MRSTSQKRFVCPVATVHARMRQTAEDGKVFAVTVDFIEISGSFISFTRSLGKKIIWG